MENENRFKEQRYVTGAPPEVNAEIRRSNERIGASFYKAAAVPSLIYAFVTMILLFENHRSWSMSVWAVATIVYVNYMMTVTVVKRKKTNILYEAALVLLGISTMFTGSPAVIFMNYIVFTVLTAAMLVHTFYDTSEWHVIRSIGSVIYGVIGPLTTINRPFKEGSALRKLSKAENSEKDGKKTGLRSPVTRSILLGILIAVPLVALLGTLLQSADPVFEEWLRIIGIHIRLIRIFLRILMVFAVYVIAYAGYRFFTLERISSVKSEIHKGGNVITAATVIGILDIMYLIFSLVQIIYLFIGGLELPEGVTYSEYARSGFFQLLVVALINIIIILIMKTYIKGSIFLDAELLIFCICSIIMTFSSALRMSMYIRAYNLTFLRIIVLYILALLVLILAGCMIYIFSDRFPMFKYVIACMTIIYLLFAFGRVDYVIADYNLKRVDLKTAERAFKPTDADYYGHLSTDAAEPIYEYLTEHGYGGDLEAYMGSDADPAAKRLAAKYNKNIEDELEDYSFWKYNYSVSVADKYFGDH